MTTPTTFFRLLRVAPNATLLTAAALAATACAAATPAPPPVAGGQISTLPMGTYSCELPGDAASAVGKPVAEYQFRIVNSSSYKSGGIRGSYLRTDSHVVMTGGPLKGKSFHRISEGFLRVIQDDGTDGEMRCVIVSHRSSKKKR